MLCHLLNCVVDVLTCSLIYTKEKNSETSKCNRRQFSWGAFSISFSCIADSTGGCVRMSLCGSLFVTYSKFVDSSCLPCFNCWCGSSNYYLFGYVNPLADPWTFYWTLLNIANLISSLPFWIKPEENILSNIPSMKRKCSSSWKSPQTGEFNFILPLFVKPVKHKWNFMSLIK